MLSQLLTWLSAWPPELAIFILGAMPIAEIRVAVPIGVGFYHLPVTAAFFWAWLGNIFAPLVILIFLPWLNKWSRHVPTFNKFLSWLLSHTRSRWLTKHQRFGEWALLIFVAVPLPFTGAWTAAIAAWLFYYPGLSATRQGRAWWWRALIFIALGAALAGLFISLVTVGVAAAITG